METNLYTHTHTERERERENILVLLFEIRSNYFVSFCVWYMIVVGQGEREVDKNDRILLFSVFQVVVVVGESVKIT